MILVSQNTGAESDYDLELSRMRTQRWGYLLLPMHKILHVQNAFGYVYVYVLLQQIAALELSPYA